MLAVHWTPISNTKNILKNDTTIQWFRDFFLKKFRVGSGDPVHYSL
jgi:hypothetical protein